MTQFSEHFHTASDGVKTYYRLYKARTPGGKAPVICLHGLTRNSKDFEDVAPMIAALGRDVMAVDVRGRGRSDRDSNPDNYQVPVYAEDVAGILKDLGWRRVVSVGTSMGGLMTMTLAAMQPDLLRGAVINDIGPEIDPEGLGRIQQYVGHAPTYASWQEAADGVRAVNGDAFPDETGDAFWLAFARRTCKEREDGRIVHDYDMAIAQAFDSGDGGLPDLWPLFDALKPVPVLLVRGALSDLLTEDTARKMEQRHPDLRLVTVERIGHAPMLTEPAAAQAITTFLKECD
ncbi:alpha/beta fold hydrolase [Marinicauda sp. Alg238-R41]|uniref:alpha/beta fold hydrolase n=1 Tax=Marinicauda sp. Alg238-R41 TaxID=2993447 RepID=UPI0022E271B8|nr:alpha/beta hydrolase [Marinicauda sp. Alg238-R41]